MGLLGAFHAFLVDRAEPIPNRVSAGSYRCTECDSEVKVAPDQTLPPCLICKSYSWEPLEAAQEPVVVRTRVRSQRR
jgi:hypothetical protein